MDRRTMKPIFALVTLAFGLLNQASDAETYTNPLDVPVADPFVYHEDGIYYLYGTDDPNNSEHGIPVLTSTDLVHWKARGYAFEKGDSTWSRRNFWGPEVVKVGSEYYMYFNASPNKEPGMTPFNMHLCIAKGKSPLGPFKEFKAPFYKPPAPDEAIDQHVFIDDDKKAYLVFTRVVMGRNEIRIVKLKKNMIEFDGEPVLAIYPTQEWESRPWEDGHRVAEGGFMFKHKKYYYLTYSGNFYLDPHYSIGYATSKSPLGPWKKYKGNPILAKTAAVEGPGNGMFVKSPDGKELFIVYHTHNKPGQVGPRKVAIDRVRFKSARTGRPDILSIKGPTSTPQPMPSGAK